MTRRPAALVFAAPTHRMACELPERIALVQSLARDSGYRKAAAIPGDEGRMSWPTTTASAPVTATNAAPTARASGSSTSSGTTPRTS